MSPPLRGEVTVAIQCPCGRKTPIYLWVIGDKRKCWRCRRVWRWIELRLASVKLPGQKADYVKVDPK